jgi:hypothetical protein
LEPRIFLAALLLTSQMLIAPPPFPALLRVNVLRVITPVPKRSTIAPPLSTAVLPMNVENLTSALPALIAPPPHVDVVAFFVKVLRVTESPSPQE